jgi:TonB-dependent SusC/RagA subfamily outer membrane receptor
MNITRTLTLAAAATAACAPLPRAGGARATPSAVNTGYGTQPRSHVTGAVASIDSAQIDAQRATSVEELLAGRVAGVEVTRGASGLTVRVRGPNSFLGGGEPLYVVDGIPIRQGLASPLDILSPRDIARIDVLKDGTAAIYGSRSANGVILITTRHRR